MYLKYFTTLFLCALFCCQALAQDIDTELSNLADKLASQIEQQGKTKVTVLDFTDLQGGSSELGKYIAEQLTVDLVMNKKGFSVLDRANLKSILAEHQLTAKGLVDPDTAKKLGMFAGVDAIILGTITPKDQNIALTAKIITTDTAEIIGAAKASFKNDSTVQGLQSTPAADDNALSAKGGADLSDDKPKVVRKFLDLVVELQSLKTLNDGQYLLTMTITNRSASNKSLWIALGTTHLGSSTTWLLDPNGNQFGNVTATGISYARIHVQYEYGGGMQEFFNPATEILPGDSDTVTLTFSSSEGRSASPGVCSLQLGFFLGDDFISGSARHTHTPNLVTKFEAK